MNVFVQNLPDNVTYAEVERTFDRPLRQCGVRDFHIEKHRGRGNATITILDVRAGQNFLATYGTIPSFRGGKPGLPLRYNNQQLRIVKDKNEPSDFAVQALVGLVFTLVLSCSLSLSRSLSLCPLPLSNGAEPSLTWDRTTSGI